MTKSQADVTKDKTNTQIKPSIMQRHHSLICRRSWINSEYSGSKKPVSLGWQPDLPDLRDRTLNSTEVSGPLSESDSIILKNLPLPTWVDNSVDCSPVDDQGSLGSCTAQAAINLLEYMMRRSGKEHVDLSRLFTYKVTRNLLGWEGDTGAYIRTSIQSIVAFGAPPETHWPYDINQFEVEPSPFLYAYAENFKALNYARIDHYGISPDDLILAIKRVLAAGFCISFGFTVYSSLSGAADVPFPSTIDKVEGGHAVLAVGYDDDHQTQDRRNIPSIIFKNSWGVEWGDHGYGYLPFEYITAGLARDFWTVFKVEWLQTGNFG
ncbi:MAG: C1 family peptidase [Paraglaciecola sp.]|uniref:C1 family peptidase n=1 Tax=Paraglaciecola sp. TaxID=1920173 RepID=UPI003297C2A1